MAFVPLSEQQKRRQAFDATSQERAFQQINQGLSQGIAGGFQARDQERERKRVEDLQEREMKVKEAAAKAVKQKANSGTIKLTPGQEQTDKEFAKDYVKFTRGGGTQAQSQIQELINASNDVVSQDATGPMIGLVPEFAQGVFTPSTKRIGDNVRGVIQSSLKEVLGAQFTEKEGQRVEARTFDPSLSPQENQRRIRRLAAQLQSAQEAKVAQAQYFERNGTLKGYKGPSPLEAYKAAQEQIAQESETIDLRNQFTGPRIIRNQPQAQATPFNQQQGPLPQAPVPQQGPVNQFAAPVPQGPAPFGQQPTNTGRQFNRSNSVNFLRSLRGQ